MVLALFRFCGVMVSTLDFESKDPRSSLGRTYSENDQRSLFMITVVIQVIRFHVFLQERIAGIRQQLLLWNFFFYHDIVQVALSLAFKIELNFSLFHVLPFSYILNFYIVIINTMTVKCVRTKTSYSFLSYKEAIILVWCNNNCLVKNTLAKLKMNSDTLYFTWPRWPPK